MRRAFIALPLLAAACVAPKPFVLNAPTPVIKARKLPLKVAVVIPEPMGSRIVEVYLDQAKYRFLANGIHDRTSLYHGEAMMPMERELTHVCSQTFPQVFAEADVLREAPDPGQYDAVIQARVTETKILQMNRSSHFDEAVSLAWELEVLDGRGVPILQKTGVTDPTPYAPIPLMIGRMDAYSKVVGAEASQALSGLVADWAAMLANSKELTALK